MIFGLHSKLASFMAIALCWSVTAAGQEIEPDSAVPLEESALPVREVIHPWARYVRGFRTGHHFGLSVGVSRGTWEIKRFGTLTPRKFSNSGVFSKFNYSFYIPFSWGFGYYLGSSTGYHFEAAERSQDFKPVASFAFPGVMAGLSYCLTPGLRISGGIDAFLERHDGIEERDNIPPDPKLHVTMTVYDLKAAFDVFYDLSWAIRFEYHYRQARFIRPRDYDGRDVDAEFEKNDQWVGFGLHYHLI